jgi:hypothetical protein
VRPINSDNLNQTPVVFERLARGALLFATSRRLEVTGVGRCAPLARAADDAALRALATGIVEIVSLLSTEEADARARTLVFEPGVVRLSCLLAIHDDATPAGVEGATMSRMAAAGMAEGR